ncbi:MAG: hypothetical protein ABFD92_16320 [Planctomycetaceae bacterium]|nr:hypothetical protein [Planctomycetaceae bacterium]
MGKWPFHLPQTEDDDIILIYGNWRNIMPDILIRGLNAAAVRRLKAKAKRNRRSLQGEVKLLLEQAAGTDKQEVTRILDKWKKEFAGKTFTPSSVELIREDRQR